MKRYEYNYGKNPEGTLSTISGYATETTNFGETAFGILNKSTRDEENFTTPEVVSSSTATLFSVGNGTDHDSRKNIIELKADGTVYINGVGLYDGTNPGESTNIADEFQGIHDDITGLNEDVDRIDNTIESIHISEDDENLIYTLLVDGQERGTINIPRDQFLKDVSYNEETNNLEFIFIVRGEDNEEVEKQINVNMTDLEDIYSAGDGLSLENKQFSVKVDADTQPYIEVSSNGVKVIGIDEKFNTVNLNVTDLTNRVTTAESDIDVILDELSNLEGSGEGSVQDQINNALEGYLPISGGTMTGSITFESAPDSNGHEYVDLGLPSGNLWAKCNVGADTEEEAGLYFQWGDTQGYTAEQVGNGEGLKAFSWANYKFSIDGSSSSLSKYNASDSKTVLDPEDDAAHVNMGGNWRMPTFDEYKELCLNTDIYLVPTEGEEIQGTAQEQSGRVIISWASQAEGTLKGVKFYKKGDKQTYMFVPAFGNAVGTIVQGVGDRSSLWTSSLFSSVVQSAWLFSFNAIYGTVDGGGRSSGVHVRGILSNSTSSSCGIVISGKSDQDLLNAAGGTTSISDILAEVPSPDLSPYATKEEVGSNIYTDSNYLSKETNLTDAVLLLDEEIKATNDNLDLEHANAEATYAKKTELRKYLPLSGGTLWNDSSIYFKHNLASNKPQLTLGASYISLSSKADYPGISTYLGMSVSATANSGYLFTARSQNGYLGENGVIGIFLEKDSSGEATFNPYFAIGKIINPTENQIYEGSPYIIIRKTGISLYNKTSNDLLNAGGSTTPISDIVTQVQAAIVDSAPETLDTLNELAAALGDDPNFATTVTNQIAQKASISGLPNNIVPAILPTPIYSDTYVRIAHQYCAKDSSSGTFGTVQSSFTQINAATSTTAGVMSAADKAKLDGIDISDYVTLDGEQTITGYKRFTGNIGCSGTSNFNGQFYIGNSNLPIGTSNIINSWDNVSDTTRKAIGIGFAQNDTFSIRGGGPTDSGFAAICTEDQGNEPLYAAQIVRNADDGISRFKNIITLMDASGNQKFNEVTASGYAITDGTADEVLTADGDSNTLKTINGQTLLGSGDVDMSEFALKTDLDDYLSAGGGTVAGDISVESIEDTNTLTITNTGINISGKTNNDLIAAAGGTISIDDLKTQIISDLSAQVSTLQTQIAGLTSRIEALETSLTKQEV